MKLINLTAHPVTDVTTGKTFPPSGIVARITTATEAVDNVCGVPIYYSTCNGVEGIPEPKEGVMYIVSALVLEHINRPDCVRPGNSQKTPDGKVLGAKGFRVNRRPNV